MIDVWAPHPDRVRLRRPDQPDVELRAGRDGWWHAEVALADGEEYGFVLGDSEDARPDPRSRRQPRGVHDLSAHFDATAFEWSDGEWRGAQLGGAIIYELHIGTFTPEGTLDAAISRFDHLIALGVTHIEVLPVNDFNGEWNWGYDGVLWYAVHESYGGPAAYQRFVDAAHARGLAVIQDVVYNHLGASGNYLPEYGPYLRSGERNTWGESVNLDEPAVRSFILDNARMWMQEYHVDGLRLDAVHALKERDDVPVHILEQLAIDADALSAHVGRPLTLIAESDMNDPTMIMAREAAGYGMAGQWSDDWHHAVHVALTGETDGYYADFAALDALPKAWRDGFFHAGSFSSFRNRSHGHPIPEAVPSYRLVVSVQNHDQIGNRAAGDRLSQSLTTDRLAIAAVLILTAPGTPMLFQGEEWAASTPWQFFTSHPEPDLAEATAKGRIEEFAQMGWDTSVVPHPNEPATFQNSKLDWDEVSSGDHARILELYRTLTALRKEKPALTDPTYGRHDAWSAETPSGRRFTLDRTPARVLVNLTEETWDVTLRGGEAVWLATKEAPTAGMTVQVAPESAAVLGPSEPAGEGTEDA